MQIYEVSSALDADHRVKGYLRVSEGLVEGYTSVSGTSDDAFDHAFGEEFEAMARHHRTKVFVPREIPPAKGVSKGLQAGDIVKTDPAKRLVFGWAYITHDRDGTLNIDKSGDFLDSADEIEKSAYDFVLKSRAGDADHTNVKASEMVESVVFTPDKIAKMGLPPGALPTGWWVGFKVHDDATWERVAKGELRAFSIHGRGTRQKVDPAAE